MRIFVRTTLAALVLFSSQLPTATAQAQVTAWGDNTYNQCGIPSLPNGVHYIQFSASSAHALGRRDDGSAVGWGSNGFGESNVPALPAGLSYVEVAAGGVHSTARRSDGSALAWGYNAYGQCNVPALPAGLTYVEVAAGAYHSMARLSDGTVAAWGDNSSGQCNVPALPAGRTYVEIAAAGSTSLARLDDGSVVAWGNNASGQCNVPALPAGVSYVEISAGPVHSVARRSDGSVVAWGDNSFGQCNVPVLPGHTYAEISAGTYHTLARVSDGSVVAWGQNTHGECNVPPLPLGLVYVQIAAGWQFSLARLDSNGIERSCFGDGTGAICPCLNIGVGGAGCDNSAATGGATLSGTGFPSLADDSVQLTATAELPSALSIVLQGSALAPQLYYGDGIRCAGGTLKRLYSKNAVNGVVVVPEGGEPSISQQSQALGDTITQGTMRIYQVYYRDPDPSFCAAPFGNTFNISSAVSVLWKP
jgi:Regulator of chromosome condensation (RCC1) repeat